MIPMQELGGGSGPNEISIVVPVLGPPKPSGSSIPIIVLTEPDHEPYDTDAEEEVDTKVAKNKQNEDNSDVPEIAVSPPSPRPERKDNTMANNISLHSTNALDDDLENNDSENLDDEEDLS